MVVSKMSTGLELHTTICEIIFLIGAKYATVLAVIMTNFLETQIDIDVEQREN